VKKLDSEVHVVAYHPSAVLQSGLEHSQTKQNPCSQKKHIKIDHDCLWILNLFMLYVPILNRC
jgi:hypothetical protein